MESSADVAEDVNTLAERGEPNDARAGEAGPAGEAVLDHPVWASLTGHHARFAETYGCAARYPVDMSPFAAISPEADDSVWQDLATLVGPGSMVAIVGGRLPPPPGWQLETIDGVQMIDVSLRCEDHPDVERLTLDDVPEMLELVNRTQPGPFFQGTAKLGTYLGIRRGRALVAMAGQRMRPGGWAEISAVCTDSEYRNQGLGTILVRAVAADIRSRGEVPFLHAAAGNTTAIRLYEELGFKVRRPVTFVIMQIPGNG
ncbi:MAG TPA: GNAT family N-acetyltransferase [Acidimicrobiales bacterium]